jgi:hypothetical protein
LPVIWFEIINRIKPYVTNNIIEVHPKGKPVYNTVNTTNYLLFTNYKDALPLDDTDRRYLILFSRWQKREDIKEFKEGNPDYYAKLYESLIDSAGAIRAWLLDHEQSDAFRPLDDAPETEARRTMIVRSKPEFAQVLNEVIAEDRTVAVSRELIEVEALSEAVMALGVSVPPPKTLAHILEREGYEKVGRLRLGDGTRGYYYATCPETFAVKYPSGLIEYAVRVRDYLDARKRELESDDL